MLMFDVDEKTGVKQVTIWSYVKKVFPPATAIRTRACFHHRLRAFEGVFLCILL
jgi:hypothetical protein